MQAMILAAGFGTRLLPYTQLRPKPLFPVLNQPLLLLTITHLQAAGFDHIIVNCHYLRQQIVTALKGLPGVIVQEEETVLGTGGGLRMALPHMRDEPLLVTNGDIYHTVDCKKLYRFHASNQFAVTMAMHNYPRFNKVTVEAGRVTGFDDQTNRNCLAFTGLHVLRPDILEAIPQHQQYSIIDRYRELLQEGEHIQAMHVDGCSWTDMGTVDDYLDLHGRLLKKEIPLWDEFATIPPDSFLIDGQAVTGKALTLQEWACVGNAHLADNIALRRCVVWDDANISQQTDLVDTLLVPGSRTEL